jgi:hypothetical protein
VIVAEAILLPSGIVAESVDPSREEKKLIAILTRHI